MRKIPFITLKIDLLQALSESHLAPSGTKLSLPALIGTDTHIQSPSFNVLELVDGAVTAMTESKRQMD